MASKKDFKIIFFFNLIPKKIKNLIFIFKIKKKIC